MKTAKRAAAILLAVASAACARALREPRSAVEIAGGPGLRPAVGIDETLLRAEDLFAGRNAGDVRLASRLWLDAAAADETRIDGLVGAARAGVWLAGHETDAGARREAATLAVEASQLCTKAAPGAPECAYWLGAALGVQARERPATGLSALSKIVEAFERAAALAPTLDDAGPDRALALLYVRAPGWPTGPGDPEKALDHARKAVRLRPGHPPNRMALAEALEASEDEEGATAAWSEAREAAQSAALRGTADAAEWIEECERRLARLPGGG